MFLNIDSLGEKTINKIAEVALTTQFKRAEKLTVQVKTDPNKLAQGILESLSIDGQGLVMSKNQQVQSMNITLNTIAVSPLKALMGNIQLTQPSNGTACIVLNDTDLNSAFQLENLKKQLKKYQIYLDGQLVTVDIQKVYFSILPNGKVGIKAVVFIKETQQFKQVSLTIVPQICTNEKGIIMEDVQCEQGGELSPLLINTLLEEAKKIFNLNNFQIEGISLLIKQLEVEQGKLTFQAVAGITRFPSV